ncbi:hypothetical protein DIPPA_31401 [Diplonema papillatum]|nr:hypothetical protein DIPPA_31401 [Diplonema papillatum]
MAAVPSWFGSASALPRTDEACGEGSAGEAAKPRRAAVLAARRARLPWRKRAVLAAVGWVLGSRRHPLYLLARHVLRPPLSRAHQRQQQQQQRRLPGIASDVVRSVAATASHAALLALAQKAVGVRSEHRRDAAVFCVVCLLDVSCRRIARAASPG